MMIRETYTEKLPVENEHGQVQRALVHETELYEAFTDDVGKLFRSCQKEHGRCTGKVYVDRPPTEHPRGSNYIDWELSFYPWTPEQVGWVFEKRVKFTDCDDTYLQEVWVAVEGKELSQ